jgi:hypothetical protein
MNTAAEIAATVALAPMQADLEEFAKRIKLSGSVEEAESFAYLERRMAALGFRTRLLRHPAFISLPGPARLVVEGADIACITHAMSRATPAEGLTAEVMDLGDGSAARFAGRDLRGAILLVDGISNPVLADRARRAGAAGTISISPNENLYEMCISPVWGSPDPATRELLPATVAITVSHTDGAALRAKLAAGSLGARIHAEIDEGWRDTPLLVCDMDALHATADAPFILLSGHHDTWYFGVMDNGAANATMIEAARACAAQRASWRRGLRVCFWSGHSHGRYSGSAWYADEHWAELDARCLAHVNVDSTGGIGATSLTGTAAALELTALARDAIAAQSGQRFEGGRMGRNADMSFWGIGIPAMFGMLSTQPEGAGALRNPLGWWWHTPHDTLDKIDTALLLRDTRVVTHALWRLLAERIAPIEPTAQIAALLAELDALAPRLDIAPLVAATRRLHEQAAAGPHGDGKLMRVSRALVPLDHTTGDRFAHDPALPQPPWPALQPLRDYVAAEPGSDAARRLAVAARRARNRVAAALAEASAVLEP